MRNKRALKQWVEEQPDRIYTLSRGETGFSDWLQERLGGRPLTLEIGMGTGDFLLQQALASPQRFFLGIEVKGDRIYRAFEKWQVQQPKNLAYLLTYAQLLPNYHLPPVEEIFVLFPDPWPKDRHSKHRLSSDRYLDIYRQLLTSDGHLTLKTDDSTLFQYSRTSLLKNGWTIEREDEDYQTDDRFCTGYERTFRSQGKPIFYLHAQPPQASEKTVEKAARV